MLKLDKVKQTNTEPFEIDFIHFWKFNNIKRYSIRLNQTYTENNTEHSFFVAVILCRLMYRYGIQNYNLLKYALIHDIGELITGDINTLCKTPELKKVLKSIEKPAIEAYSKYLNIAPVSHKEEMLLKAADVLTTYFYGKMNKVADISESGWRLFKHYLKEFKNANSK